MALFRKKKASRSGTSKIVEQFDIPLQDEGVIATPDDTEREKDREEAQVRFDNGLMQPSVGGNTSIDSHISNRNMRR